MPVNKKFLELVSKDSAVKAELDSATFKALFEFLKARGLEDEAAKAVDTAMTAVAEAHGFKPEAMEEVSDDELKAVAGGVCGCNWGGYGSLRGDECNCGSSGVGDHYPSGHCECFFPGVGAGESD